MVVNLNAVEKKRLLYHAEISMQSGHWGDSVIIVSEHQILHDRISDAGETLELGVSQAGILAQWMSESTREGRFLSSEDLSFIAKIVDELEKAAGSADSARERERIADTIMSFGRIVEDHPSAKGTSEGQAQFEEEARLAKYDTLKEDLKRQFPDEWTNPEARYGRKKPRKIHRAGKPGLVKSIISGTVEAFRKVFRKPEGAKEQEIREDGNGNEKEQLDRVKELAKRVKDRARNIR